MKKTLCLLSGFLCLSCLGLCPGPVNAQYMRNPKLNFKKFKFDMDVRGSYNITQCVADNMNCWEVVKPDLICGYKMQYPSACDILMEHCHDLAEGYDQTGYWYSLQIQEMWCNDWEAFTK